MNYHDAIELMHDGTERAASADAAWRFVTWVFWVAVAVMVLGAAVTR